MFRFERLRCVLDLIGIRVKTMVCLVLRLTDVGRSVLILQRTMLFGGLSLHLLITYFTHQLTLYLFSVAIRVEVTSTRRARVRLSVQVIYIPAILLSMLLPLFAFSKLIFTRWRRLVFLKAFDFAS